METTNNNPVYDVNYFIRKFEAIPEEKWHIGDYCNEERTQYCAFGHCGLLSKFVSVNDYPEAFGLLSVLPSASFINDGIYPEYKQFTAKQRILAALYDIKKIQEKEKQPEPPKEKVVHVYHSVEVAKEIKELEVINN